MSAIRKPDAADLEAWVQAELERETANHPPQLHKRGDDYVRAGMLIALPSHRERETQ